MTCATNSHPQPYAASATAAECLHERAARFLCKRAKLVLSKKNSPHPSRLKAPATSSCASTARPRRYPTIHSWPRHAGGHLAKAIEAAHPPHLLHGPRTLKYTQSARGNFGRTSLLASSSCRLPRAHAASPQRSAPDIVPWRAVHTPHSCQSSLMWHATPTDPAPEPPPGNNNAPPRPRARSPGGYGGTILNRRVAVSVLR